MSKPVSSFRVGNVNVAVWENEFDGKPSKSYTIKKQKKNKDTGNFEDTPFLTVTDLKDIIIACQKLLMDHYELMPSSEPF
jgi:hypothetical protein